MASNDTTPSQALTANLTGLGFTGGIADLQLQWLESKGFETGSLTDRWISMMDDRSIAAGGFNERKKAFYETVAGSSSNLSINELRKSYWVLTDIPPILNMPLVRDLSLLVGVGSATFTRSTIATFVDRSDGLVKTASIDTARFETKGVLVEGASTNEALRSRDFTNAVHVKTNVTAVKDAIGADGINNSASTLTATAANGTVFQTITKLSAENTFTIDVRRKTGLGTIEISDNGGSTFTDITSSINTSTYSRFDITTTQTNPSIGLRIVTSGDEVEVDYEGLEELSFASSRIETNASSVARTADSISVDAANMPDPSADYSVTGEADILGFTGSAQLFFNVLGESFRLARLRDPGRLNQPSFISATTGTNAVVGNVVSANIVNKMAMTSDSSVLKIYQDAVLKDTDTAADNPGGTKTAVNIANSSSGDQLFGHLKNFRIYNVALTLEQIEAL